MYKLNMFVVVCVNDSMKVCVSVVCKAFKHTGKCTDIIYIWQQLYHNNVLVLCQRFVSMQYFKTKNTCSIFNFASFLEV